MFAVPTCLALLALVGLPVAEAVKCYDCVGKNCMGAFCNGDYCMHSQYAPRWGTIEWGVPKIVKGCISGAMLRRDLRDHCETVDEDGQEIFTCFCSDKDLCNSGKAIKRLPIQQVPLLTCHCTGGHCQGKTCLGELCSYVVNHGTKEVEQGCVNASVPLMERRTAGACMIPPITGAMHHTVAKDASDLLKTESCICGSDFCNKAKPKITVPERQKCGTWVNTKVLGLEMASKNTTCTGEFCFRARIKSELGSMKSYQTIGCASFVDEYELSEEFNPTGCAIFESENLSVETCFLTKDAEALERAEERKEIVQPRRKPSKMRQKGKQSKKPPAMEVDEYEEEEEEREGKGRKNKAREEEEEVQTFDKEVEEAIEEEAESGGKKPESNKGAEEIDEEEEKPHGHHTPRPQFIFEGATEAPIPEDSNAALIAVFLLVMLLIVMAGVVYKFQLHKRLFRASYDTVAGG